MNEREREVYIINTIQKMKASVHLFTTPPPSTISCALASWQVATYITCRFPSILQFSGITFGNGKVKMLVRVNQELIPKVLDIEATSERVDSSSKAYHELIAL